VALRCNVQPLFIFYQNLFIMKRTLSFIYGLICYLIFLGSFLYAIGFVGNLFVPKSIDGEAKGSLLINILINATLLLLFALQHSIMARPAFKRWWTKIIPSHLERSTYVLLASLCLLLMMGGWHPIGGTVWHVEHAGARSALLILFGTGWMIVLVSTFLINHFDLFGLRQVWLYFNGKAYTDLPFRVPVFYRFVRHPLYLGFLIAFWSTPHMTVAHLLFALLTTAYIFTAIQLEERDLQVHFGRKYRDYKNQVPMILPVGKSKAAEQDTEGVEQLMG
jgi:methanethiol S-methyltransferase